MDEAIASKLKQHLINTKVEAIDPSNTDFFFYDLQHILFQRLREECPVHYCPTSNYGAFWSISKYEHVVEIESDFEAFTSTHGFTINEIPADAPRSFMRMDPPDHLKTRRHLTMMNTTEWLSHLQMFTTEMISELLAKLPIAIPFDWNQDVANYLSSLILAKIIGVRAEDAARLHQWSETAMLLSLRPTPISAAKQQQQLKQVKDYFRDHCIKSISKHREPSAIDMLMNAHSDNSISIEQAFLDFLIILIGGMETTRHAITGSALFLDKHQDERQKLYANQSLLRAMASEVFRFQTPLSHMRRTATKDINFHGHRIKKGDKIILWYASANRDPALFEQPDTFLIDRVNHNRQLAFGSGPHQCIGKNIAYLELQLLWQELIKRGLVVKPVSKAKKIRSNFIHGYSSLHVTLESI